MSTPNLTLTMPRRKSGHFTCQLNRTYHMSTTHFGHLVVPLGVFGPMPLVGQVTIENPNLGLVYESQMVENDPGKRYPCCPQRLVGGALLRVGTPPLRSQTQPMSEQKQTSSWIFREADIRAARSSFTPMRPGFFQSRIARRPQDESRPGARRGYYHHSTRCRAHPDCARGGWMVMVGASTVWPERLWTPITNSMGCDESLTSRSVESNPLRSE